MSVFLAATCHIAEAHANHFDKLHKHLKDFWGQSTADPQLDAGHDLETGPLR